MRSLLLILISLILIFGAVYLLFFRPDIIQINNGSTTPTPTPGATVTPQPTSAFDAEIPNDWTKMYDSNLVYSAYYPSGWYLRPATSDQGESAFYSFNPQQAVATEPVPADQIKIAVVYFPANDPRQITFNQSDITSEELTTVDSFAATRRVLDGQLGSAISTEVELDDSRYLITAYPADSQFIDDYDLFLNSLDLQISLPVTIDRPALGATISSPVTVEGQAPGNWFFEANLPIMLQSLDGQVLAQQSFTTTDDWMTENPINFSQQISFDSPDDNFGFIVIQSDNPSGIPKNASSFYWPVEF